MIDRNQLEEIAFNDFARYAIAQPIMIGQFKDATGHDLGLLANSSPIERMIDAATGYKDAMMSEFLQWLRLSYWE